MYVDWFSQYFTGEDRKVIACEGKGTVVIGDLSPSGGADRVSVHEERSYDLAQFFSDEELRRSKLLRYCLDKRLIKPISASLAKKIDVAQISTDDASKYIEGTTVDNDYEEEVDGINADGSLKLAESSNGNEDSDKVGESPSEENAHQGTNPDFEGVTAEEFISGFKSLGGWQQQVKYLRETPNIPVEFLNLIADGDFPASVKKAALEKLN